MCSTIVLGVSNNPERYSYRALVSLRDSKYPVVGVNPRIKEIEQIPVYPTLELASEALKSVHTITMYIGEARSNLLIDDIIATKPERVIFNPGSENRKLELELKSNGIECIHACTLVLLSTGNYK